MQKEHRDRETNSETDWHREAQTEAEIKLEPYNERHAKYKVY